MTTAAVAVRTRAASAAGALLAVSAVGSLLIAAQLAIAVTDAVVIPVPALALAFVATAARCAAFLLLALRVRAAGASRVGLVALIVWGAVDLVLLALPVEQLLPLGSGLLAVGAATQLLRVAAVVVSVVAVVRAGVLGRWTRAALVVLGGFEALLGLLGWMPVEPLLLAVATLDTRVVGAALLLVLAALMALEGRGDAVRARLRRIRDAW